MSTESGDAAVVKAAVDQARVLLGSAGAEQQELQLLDPLTADEIFDAREALGPFAGKVAVMRQARENRAGRPKGVRNRRTDDFAKYISQFGQDPAITLMQIQSTAAEELVARSEMLDPEKRRMSYADAVSLKVRCAEALMPYIHSKKPVAVDMTFNGVADLFIEGVTHSAGEIADIIDADFMDIDGPGNDGAGNDREGGE